MQSRVVWAGTDGTEEGEAFQCGLSCFIPGVLEQLPTPSLFPLIWSWQHLEKIPGHCNGTRWCSSCPSTAAPLLSFLQLQLLTSMPGVVLPKPQCCFDELCKYYFNIRCDLVVLNNIIASLLLRACSLLLCAGAGIP